MADLKVVRGKRAHVHHRDGVEQEVRVTFIPADGAILCVVADNFYPIQITVPVTVTIPKAFISYIPAEEQ